MARISSIKFDRNELPLRATIITSQGTVKVHWVDHHWFSTGDLDAQKLAVPLVERIERMVQHL